MNFRLLFPMLLVIVQIALFTCLVEERSAVLVATAAVVMTVALRHKGGLDRLPHLCLITCTSITFAMLGISAARSGTDIRGLFQLFAECLLVLQSLELLGKPRDNTRNYYPGLASLSVTLLVLAVEPDARPASLESIYLGLTVLLFLVLRNDLVALFGRDRAAREKAVTLTIVLIATIAIGALFQQEIRRDLPQLRKILGDFQSEKRTEEIVRLAGTGFVEQVGLNSIAEIQRVNPDNSVFDVDADAPPGYMRTLSFSTFSGIFWRESSLSRGGRTVQQLLRPSSLPTELDGIRMTTAQRVFQIGKMASAPLDTLTVSVSIGSGDLVPVPMNGVYVIAQPKRRNRLAIDAHGNIIAGSLDNRSYRIITGNADALQLNPDYRQGLLQLPQDDARFLREFSNQLCGPASVEAGKLSDSDKIEQIRNYLTSNYEYALESDPAKDIGDRSPIRAFLEDRRAAHCEYFATASVLLLRAQGIPSRLSTGYLVYELNDENDFYQATNGKAHAWTEAYDASQHAWIVVEATPGIAEYVLQFDAQTGQNSFGNLTNNKRVAWFNWSAISTWLWELVVEVRSLLADRHAWILPFLLAGQLILLRYLRHKRRNKSPGRTTLSRQVRKADSLARRWGYCRAAHETCQQFAGRLAAAGSPDLGRLADWYMHYGQIRYRPARQGDQTSAQITCPPLPTIRPLRRPWSRAQQTNPAGMSQTN